MKTLVLSLLVIASIGCRSTKMKNASSNDTVQMKPAKEKVAILGYSKQIADSLQPVKIQTASILGNLMTIHVSYSGGCEKHSFSLEGSTTIAKSMPAVRGIRLVHTGKKDLCKAMVMQTLTFDISSLAYKQEKGSEIFLQLEGYEGGKLLYTYSVSK